MESTNSNLPPKHQETTQADTHHTAFGQNEWKRNKNNDEENTEKY